MLNILSFTTFLLSILMTPLCYTADHRTFEDESEHVLCTLGNQREIQVLWKLLSLLDSHLISCITEEVTHKSCDSIDLSIIPNEQAFYNFIKVLSHQQLVEPHHQAVEDFLHISDYLGIKQQKIIGILKNSADAHPLYLRALAQIYAHRKALAKNTELLIKPVLEELSPYYMTQRLGLPRNEDSEIGHTKSLTCVTALDEKTIATASLDHTIIIWKKNAQNAWELTQRLGYIDNDDSTLGHTDWIVSIKKYNERAMLSFGEQVIEWRKDDHGEWRIAQQIVNTPDTQVLYEGAIRAIPSIHLHEKKIIVAYGDRTAMIWQQEPNNCWRPAQQIGVPLNADPAVGHVGDISGFANIDKNSFVSISIDRTALIWQKNADTFCTNLLS